MKLALILTGLLITGMELTASETGARKQIDVLLPFIEGWTRLEGEIIYTRANLFDLIDGAADLFLSYGFVDLRTARYIGIDSTVVRVELYRHDSRDNAFGMYSAERAPEYRFIDVGTQGYMEEGVLNFLSGIFYVKIMTREEGDRGRDAMTLVARHVHEALRQDDSWPEVLEFFPQKGKLANAEGYIAENFLGYKFLRSAFTAEYNQRGRFRLFIIAPQGPGETEHMAQRYLTEIGAEGASRHNGSFFFDDPNNGPIALAVEGRYLCGVAYCSETSSREAALTDLRARIRQVTPRE